DHCYVEPVAAPKPLPKPVQHKTTRSNQGGERTCSTAELRFGPLGTPCRTHIVTGGGSKAVTIVALSIGLLALTLINVAQLGADPATDGLEAADAGALIGEAASGGEAADAAAAGRAAASAERGAAARAGRPTIRARMSDGTDLSDESHTHPFHRTT